MKDKQNRSHCSCNSLFRQEVRNLFNLVIYFEQWLAPEVWRGCSYYITLLWGALDKLWYVGSSLDLG